MHRQLMLCLTIGLLFNESTARAEDAAAVELTKKGIAAVAAGRHDEAVRAYRAAYERMHEPALLFAIVDSELELARCDDALKTANESVVASSQETTGTRDQDLKEAGEKVGLVQRTCIVASVTSTPPGAAVWVGEAQGPSQGVTPWTAVLKLGDYRVTARKDDYSEVTEVLHVTADAPPQLQLTLQPLATQASPGGNDDRSSSRRPVQWAPIIPTGLTIAAVAVGATGTALFLGCPTRVQLPQEEYAAAVCQNQNATVANIGWAAAGVGAVVSGVLWWVALSGSGEPRKPAPVQLGITSNQVTLSGSF